MYIKDTKKIKAEVIDVNADDGFPYTKKEDEDLIYQVGIVMEFQTVPRKGDLVVLYIEEDEADGIEYEVLNVTHGNYIENYPPASGIVRLYVRRVTIHESTRYTYAQIDNDRGEDLDCCEEEDDDGW